MKKLNTLALLILFILIPHLHAQVRAVVGGGTGVVYSNLQVNVLTGVEIPVKRVEFDFLNSFSPYEGKSGLGTGTADSVSATGIFWIKNVGLTGGLSFSEYSVSIHKHAYDALGGVVFRLTGTDPMRFQFNYVQQVWNRFDARTGIESSYLKGFHFVWTTRLGCNHVGCARIFATFDAGKVKLQSNQHCDGTLPGPITCPRATAASGGSTGGLVFEFPRPKNPEVF